MGTINCPFVNFTKLKSIRLEGPGIRNNSTTILLGAMRSPMAGHSSTRRDRALRSTQQRSNRRYLGRKEWSDGNFFLETHEYGPSSMAGAKKEEAGSKLPCWSWGAFMNGSMISTLSDLLLLLMHNRARLSAFTACMLSDPSNPHCPLK
jgi:hypothetical protein